MITIGYCGYLTKYQMENWSKLSDQFIPFGQFREYQGKIYLGGWTTRRGKYAGYSIQNPTHVVVPLDANTPLKIPEVIPESIPIEILKSQPDITKDHNDSKSTKEQMTSDLLGSNRKWRLYNYRNLLVKNTANVNQPTEYIIGESFKEYSNHSPKFLFTVGGAIVLDCLSSPLQLGMKIIGPSILRSLLKDWT